MTMKLGKWQDGNRAWSSAGGGGGGAEKRVRKWKGHGERGMVRRGVCTGRGGGTTRPSKEGRRGSADKAGEDGGAKGGWNREILVIKPERRWESKKEGGSLSIRREEYGWRRYHKFIGKGEIGILGARKEEKTSFLNRMGEAQHRRWLNKKRLNQKRGKGYRTSQQRKGGKRPDEDMAEGMGYRRKRWEAKSEVDEGSKEGKQGNKGIGGGELGRRDIRSGVRVQRAKRPGRGRREGPGRGCQKGGERKGRRAEEQGGYGKGRNGGEAGKKKRNGSSGGGEGLGAMGLALGAEKGGDGDRGGVSNGQSGGREASREQWRAEDKGEIRGEVRMGCGRDHGRGEGKRGAVGGVGKGQLEPKTVAAEEMHKQKEGRSAEAKCMIGAGKQYVTAAGRGGREQEWTGTGEKTKYGGKGTAAEWEEGGKEEQGVKGRREQSRKNLEKERHGKKWGDSPMGKAGRMVWEEGRDEMEGAGTLGGKINRKDREAALGKGRNRKGKVRTCGGGTVPGQEEGGGVDLGTERRKGGRKKGKSEGKEQNREGKDGTRDQGTEDIQGGKRGNRETDTVRGPRVGVGGRTKVQEVQRTGNLDKKSQRGSGAQGRVEGKNWRAGTRNLIGSREHKITASGRGRDSRKISAVDRGMDISRGRRGGRASREGGAVGRYKWEERGRNKQRRSRFRENAGQEQGYLAGGEGITCRERQKGGKEGGRPEIEGQGKGWGRPDRRYGDQGAHGIVRESGGSGDRRRRSGALVGDRVLRKKKRLRPFEGSGKKEGIRASEDGERATALTWRRGEWGGTTKGKRLSEWAWSVTQENNEQAGYKEEGAGAAVRRTARGGATEADQPGRKGAAIIKRPGGKEGTQQNRRKIEWKRKIWGRGEGCQEEGSRGRGERRGKRGGKIRGRNERAATAPGVQDVE
ncbi:hypothetical protein Tco_0793734 [Tanacetum coccineum]